jgi:hypothetical protein
MSQRRPPLELLLQNFQFFSSLDPLDNCPAVVLPQTTTGALVDHMPAAVVQHPGDHPRSIAPKFSRQFNDVLRRP